MSGLGRLPVNSIPISFEQPRLPRSESSPATWPAPVVGGTAHMSSRDDRRRPICTVAEDTMDESRLWWPTARLKMDGGGLSVSHVPRTGPLDFGEYVVAGRRVADELALWLLLGNRE